MNDGETMEGEDEHSCYDAVVKGKYLPFHDIIS